MEPETVPTSRVAKKTEGLRAKRVFIVVILILCRTAKIQLVAPDFFADSESIKGKDENDMKNFCLPKNFRKKSNRPSNNFGRAVLLTIDLTQNDKRLVAANLVVVADDNR